MSEQPKPPSRIFPTSKVDARAAEHVPSVPQTESEAYKLAFQDSEFLLREDLRPVRFQLELLKPELLLNEAGIASTFVFYGSARVPAPDMADALIEAATNDEQQAIAERLKAKSPFYDVARELARLASSCGGSDDPDIQVKLARIALGNRAYGQALSRFQALLDIVPIEFFRLEETPGQVIDGFPDVDVGQGIEGILQFLFCWNSLLIPLLFLRGSIPLPVVFAQISGRCPTATSRPSSASSSTTSRCGRCIS